MEVGIVVGWLFLLIVLGGLAVPIVARLFPGWPTNGLGFALPVATLTLGFVAFWVGRVAFGGPALVAGLLVLAGVAAWLGFDRDAITDLDATPTREDLREMTAFDWDVNRPAVVETLVVFLAAFGFLLAVRAVDPAITEPGGEKFLDFGLVQSLLRSSTLPPEDMWFAGEPVRYYYGGHMVTALLAIATGTPAAVAYNVALATFFGMYVTAAFDLAGAVATARGYARRPAAWAGAFFVALGANLQTTGVLLLRALPADLRAALVNELSPAIRRQIVERLDASFNYWSASRVIPGTINEFPLFAFLNGDLHAHMTDTPYLLFAAAIAFAIFRSSDAGRRRLLTFGVLPVVGAFVAVVNTWSFPTVFGVAWLALALGPASPRDIFPEAVRDRLDEAFGPEAVPDGGYRSPDLRVELTRPVVAAGVVAVAGVVAAVLAAPFFLGAAQAGSERTIATLPAQVQPTETVGPFTTRSTFGGLLVVHGAFLVLFGAYLFDRIGTRRPVELLAAFGVLLLTASVLSLPALALAGGVVLAGWIAVRSGRAGFGTALAVGGAGLVVLVEVVYLNEQAGPGRFNTVFKTYAQVWALWAPAAGVAIAGLLGRVETPTVWPSGNARQVATAMLVVCVVASSGGYATQALPAHFASGDDPASEFADGYPEEPTLNGTAYVEEFYGENAPAIRYLDGQPGQPTILSAPATGRYPGDQPARSNPIGMYRWHSNPAASLTGLPTVAGWAHERGYRGGEAYFDRVSAVDRAFTDRAALLALLDAHDVQYIWVGRAERSRYADELVDFTAIPGLERVETASTEEVTLYRVDHDELPDDGG